MGEPRYHGPAPKALRIAALDVLTAVYHRPSGITHLLAPPAPEMLDALAGATLTADELLDQLAARFELGAVDAAALEARLAELVDAGLVARA